MIHSGPVRFVIGGMTALILICGLSFTAHASDESIEFDYFDGISFDDSVPSPSGFLGYEIGERFTRHADMVAYMRALAGSSDRVTFREYGRSHQNRVLSIVTISSADNIAKLDEILASNLELTDPASLDESRLDEIAASNPSLAWLSFGVHGNEASTTETAIQVAYELAAGQHPDLDEMLENVVVVIDPQLNPDGRMRYVAWYENIAGKTPNPSTAAEEHYEPWPGGRTNHYLFDLNRDWVWLTQPESASRIQVYREYMPHLHIDCHEQGYRSPYFFGPGDTPYGEHIPQSTKDWLTVYGDHNEKVFDARGLEFSTRERFDYLYPGYGKVLPCYHGAVGMLTEQGGHAFAGLSVELSDQRDLTLRTRAYHHYLTSLSYVETTAANREGQIRRFASFFEEAMERGEREPFVAVLDPERVEIAAQLAALLEGHGIEYIADVREHPDTGEEHIRLIVDAQQPLGALVRTLFSEETFVEDRDTYDITSWNAAIAFGVDLDVSAETPSIRQRLPLEELDLDSLADVVAGVVEIEGVVREGAAAQIAPKAVVFPADATHFPRIVGWAVAHDLVVRRLGEDVTLRAISGDGSEIVNKEFETGSLFVNAIANPEFDFATIASSLESELFAEGYGVVGISAEKGRPLGANLHPEMPLPRIALVRGSPVNSNSFGQHWWLLDVDQKMPHTVIDIDRLTRVDMDEYNVLVLPHGTRFDGSTLEAVSDWVRGGGTLIASGSAASWAGSTLLELEPVPDLDERKHRIKPNMLTYEQRRQRSVDDRVPGATLKVEIDTTHPISAGIGDSVGVIIRSDRRLPVADNTHVIGRYAAAPRMNGSISEENERRMGFQPFWTLDRMSSGNVIRIGEDTTLRGFQKAPMRMLLNSIIYGPGM